MVAAAVKIVAQKLGNKPATCRSYYVHPCVIDRYLERKLARFADLAKGDSPDTKLSAEEAGVLLMIADATEAAVINRRAGLNPARCDNIKRMLHSLWFLLAVSLLAPPA